MRLNDDWVFENYMDFEYKKYTLLAYVKEVRESFNNKLLSPYFKDVINHLNKAESFVNSTRALENSFKKNIIGINKTGIIYDSFKDPMMDEILRTTEYAIPKFSKCKIEGESLKEEVESLLSIHPIGVQPRNLSYGMILVRPGTKIVHIFEYQSVIDNHIGLEKLSTEEISIINTYENIKTKSLKFIKYPLPATFVAETSKEFPLENTLLEIVLNSINNKIYKSSGK